MSEIVILHAGERARLDPTLSGFAHGFGIFETIRLSARRLCFWKAHWQRLGRSANALNLSFDVSEEAVLTAIRDLVEADAFYDGTVKLSLLRDGAGSCCYVYTRPAIMPMGLARLQLVEDVPLNEHSLLAGHKTHNYMENMLLLESARTKGFSDVIRVNTAGVLTETTVANLFFIQDGQLRTPARSTGILPGVIREEILQLAKALPITVVEGRFLVDVLKEAEAVFLTNSSVGILPVDTISAEDFSVTLLTETHPIVEALTAALADLEARHSILLLDD